MSYRRPCHIFVNGPEKKICATCGYHVTQHHDAAAAFYARERASTAHDDRPLLAALLRALIAAVEGRREDAQREIEAARQMAGAVEPEGPLTPEERADCLKWLENLP